MHLPDLVGDLTDEKTLRLLTRHRRVHEREHLAVPSLRDRGRRSDADADDSGDNLHADPHV